MPLADGAAILRKFAASEAPALMTALQQVLRGSPLRQMTTPGGYLMSVSMTNCGHAGWISDRRGYRYGPMDPLSGRPWPRMPGIFQEVASKAAAAAGYGQFETDACLVSCYEPSARLSLHQDRNEIDFAAPIVSVSLGLPAVFLFGGPRRNDRPRRIWLESGDIVVWGGNARLNYHGIAPLAEGDHPLTGRCRINLSFRKAL